MRAEATLYVGRVVHKRMRPKQHALNYGVFSFLLDVDCIEDVSQRSKLFSYNAANVLSIHDNDFGAGDGTSIAESARQTLQEAGLARDGQQVFLLAYPRVWGYAFNPLSVFYVMEHDGALSAVIYEVSNTFGERMRYVMAVGVAHNGVFMHGCDKKLFVSPFADGNGTYSFRLSEPDAQAQVAILYRDGKGPLLKAHFHGVAEHFSDANLLKALLRHPLLSWKVISGIHWEALKLWLKGVPLVKGHTSPKYSVRLVSSSRQ